MREEIHISDYPALSPGCEGPLPGPAHALAMDANAVGPPGRAPRRCRRIPGDREHSRARAAHPLPPRSHTRPRTRSPRPTRTPHLGETPGQSGFRSPCRIRTDDLHITSSQDHCPMVHWPPLFSPSMQVSRHGHVRDVVIVHGVSPSFRPRPGPREAQPAGPAGRLGAGQTGIQLNTGRRKRLQHTDLAKRRGPIPRRSFQCSWQCSQARGMRSGRATPGSLTFWPNGSAPGPPLSPVGSLGHPCDARPRLPRRRTRTPTHAGRFDPAVLQRDFAASSSRSSSGPVHDAAHRLAWSDWQRCHQALTTAEVLTRAL